MLYKFVCNRRVDGWGGNVGVIICGVEERRKRVELKRESRT